MPPDHKPPPLLLLLKLVLLACVLGVLLLGAVPLYRVVLHITGLAPLAEVRAVTVVISWPVWPEGGA